jgi:hypothetical protein
LPSRLLVNSLGDADVYGNATAAIPV